MFAYIAAAPFVAQNHYGLAPRTFGAMFAIIALGIVAVADASRVLLRRAFHRQPLRLNLRILGVGAAGLPAWVLLEARATGVA